MKKHTIYLLLALLFCAGTACEEKEEDIILPKKIDFNLDSHASGADPIDPGPPKP